MGESQLMAPSIDVLNAEAVSELKAAPVCAPAKPLYLKFQEDLIDGVIARLNKCYFSSGLSPSYRPSLTTAALTGKSHRRPNTLLRHMVSYVLYNHPAVTGIYTTTNIAHLLKRDHTTVISGLRRMEGFISTMHPHAYQLQEVCDRMAPAYGAFDVWAPLGITDRDEVPRIPPSTEDRRKDRVSVRREAFRKRNEEIIQKCKTRPHVAVAARYGLSESTVQRILKQGGGEA